MTSITPESGATAPVITAPEGTVQEGTVPEATLVIPTWNGARWLGPCLDSLRRQSAWGRFEVVVVDDGSTDETPSLLAGYPWCRVLWRGENRGFTSAVNAGIRDARAPIVMLLNNDTEADPAWVTELLAALNAQPTAGMATSKVLTMADRAVIHTTGDTVDVAGAAANRGVWERDTGQWDSATEVFSPSGAACAIRRTVFDSVGLLEERFGSYLEDVDLGWRARLAGFGCIFVPSAIVFHQVSATGGGPYASFRVGRNRIWLIARNYPAGPLARHFGAVVATLVRQAGAALRHIRGEAARATFAGLAVGAVTWPVMLPERRRIQSRRKLTDAEFEALLSPPRRQ